MEYFKSNFCPNEYIEKQILKQGCITAFNESPSEMVERVVSVLFKTEVSMSNNVKNAKRFADNICRLIDERKIIFSTPILTNIGRSEFKRPLSACTIPSISLKDDLLKIRNVVNIYHQEGMGIGFNLDEVDDPVSMLMFLNEISIEGAASEKENRPVGNIGMCSIDHPRIVDFITSKMTRRNMLWKFNLSVNTPESFWFAVKNDLLWRLRNGDVVYAKELFQLMAHSAHACADPGIIFMERINRDNPVPASGTYHGVAPCAEVGLSSGETCHFGYINLGAFCRGKDLDFDGIMDATKTMVRALDNCLEISIPSFSTKISADIVRQRRKIGVGICGLADALVFCEIPYASVLAREFARDIVAYINYHSKIASHELAKERGSFGAMSAFFGCKYTENPNFLEIKYGDLNTLLVSKQEWKKLGSVIKYSKMLRNSSTVALPPTGRSALIIDASTGIEPMFSLLRCDGSIATPVKHALRSLLKKEYETEILNGNGLGSWCDLQKRTLLSTSIEISTRDHLLMVAALQPTVDESISKTINIPSDAKISEVENIYLQAYTLNLKGITMYRDGTLPFQPRKLQKTTT